jgi:anthranilate phosphoribosyltransferase
VYFNSLIQGDTFSRKEAAGLFSELLADLLNDYQRAAVLGALHVRGLSVDELLGAMDALLATSLYDRRSFPEAIDLCGTGGDGKRTFNISTTAAFIVAGAGYKVIKNGNYGASSAVGSSHVLEELGISFPKTKEELEDRGLDPMPLFVHAPLFYPALARVAPIRKALGFRTVFNTLGPLLNPARPGTHVCGVNQERALHLYSKVLPDRVKKYAVLMCKGGYDEISLTAPAIIKSYRGDFELTPSDLGLQYVDPVTLEIDNVPQVAAVTLREIVQGNRPGPQEDVAVANAAIVIWTYEEKMSLPEAVRVAFDSIRSGKAGRVLVDSCNSEKI